MGQCEIVIKRTQEIDDESLFHSDTFLGDEFSDEMYHWKYIKKKKVNGKWRYYYDTTELDKYKNNVVETEISKGATQMIRDLGVYDVTKRNITNYKTSNRLFDKTSDSLNNIVGSNGHVYLDNHYYQYQGKLSRAYAKAEKKIYNTFYKGKYANQKASSLKHKAAKAKEKIKSLLKIR